jgi:phosphatidylserine/phosphatidylglycerophosphate/cardiolipin synthase-like enzyme
VSFEQAAAVGPIQPYFLTQIDGEVDDTPLTSQPALDAITAQARQVAQLFAGFVGDAHESLDVCIYDFRLDLSDVQQTIVDAINGAAERGVRVRVAYDKREEAGDAPILKRFEEAGGDPAPTGTDAFLSRALSAKVQRRAVAEEDAVAEKGIDPGSRIMHDKFMVRDAGTPDAAVWMGSTNFTVDAWALQENNILVFTSCPELAKAYTTDFNDLWEHGRISGTGTGNDGAASVDGQNIAFAFAPGEGRDIEKLIADTITGARTRLRIASMVTSSEKILTALNGQLGNNLDFNGIYDRGETENVAQAYRKAGPKDAHKLALLEAAMNAMVAKDSLPFKPDSAHNFMHNKIVVADDTVVSGSFNFSLNATRNAENVVAIKSQGLADAYAGYIDRLVDRYR